MTAASAPADGSSGSPLARRSLEGHQATWVICGVVGALGLVAMFLPAAEVELGGSGKNHALVPIRDSLAIAAIPIGASVCLIVCAVVALKTTARRITLIILALLATAVGGGRALDVSAGFSDADTKGVSTVGPKHTYGGDLFAALVKLGAKPTHPNGAGEEEEIAADAFWGTGWYLLVGSMLVLSLVLMVRLLWVVLPLWTAAPLGLFWVFVFWVIIWVATIAGHGGLE